MPLKSELIKHKRALNISAMASWKTTMFWVFTLVAMANLACTSVGDGTSTMDVTSVPIATSVLTEPDNKSVQGESNEEDSAQLVSTSTIEVSEDDLRADPSNVDEPVPTETFTAEQVVAAFESVITGVFQDSLKSVVEISVSGIDGVGSGSGFVWDEHNHIVTNQHVVAGAQQLEVSFSDGRSYAATVIGEDADSDVAVLEVITDDVFVPIKLGDSDAVIPGQISVAIGNPFGEEFTLTQGIVSAVGRSIRSGNQGFTTPDVIQTDAAINPGNSGGPLLNRYGEVIGINAQIRSDSRQNSGVGFAVPVNIAKLVIPELLENGEFVYAWLGVSGHDMSRLLAEALDLPEGTLGAYISEVIAGGPSQIAGINGSTRTIRLDGQAVDVGGDTVIGIDGWPIRSMADLISYLTSNARPGDTVTLEIIEDGGNETEKEVELGMRP